MEKEKNEYPNNINPNPISRANLAIERAKMAMSLSKNNSPEANKLRNDLLDREDPGEKK